MEKRKFKINSKYSPAGDQPKAIEALARGIQEGDDAQTLLGITGSGKTFTIANVIEKVQKPTLIIAHNKTLAAQLYNEFKELFPDNAVEYFISYYDYYQPEAYIPRTDTYIEKSASINDEIDRLRHNSTRSLYERNDVIIVASVSCIYGLGLPENYFRGSVELKVGDEVERDTAGCLFALSGVLDQKAERRIPYDLCSGQGTESHSGYYLSSYITVCKCASCRYGIPASAFHRR